MEIRLEGFSESRTKFVSYFGHPLKPREATVRSEVVFLSFLPHENAGANLY